MKILTVSNLYPPKIIGGAELIAHSIDVKLAARGHTVHAVTLGPIDGNYTIDGVQVDVLQCRNFYPPLLVKKKSQWIKPLWHMRDVYNRAMRDVVSALLEKKRPDIVHCHNVTGFSCSVWDSAKKMNIPVVQHIHDHQLMCIHAELLRKNGKRCNSPNLLCKARSLFIVGRMKGRINHLLFPSRYCFLNYMKRHENEIAHIAYSVLPSATDYAEHLPVKGNWSTGPLNLLFLGSIAVNKGFAIFEEVVSRLNSIKLDVQIHVAGTGQLQERAVALAKEQGNVIYHGYVTGDAKLDLFRSAHLYVFPSLCQENSPVSIAEALALGVPVLASNVGGVPEQVNETWTVEPGNAQVLSEKIKHLYHNRHLLKQESERLLKARSAFSLEKTIERVDNIYQSILNPEYNSSILVRNP